MRNKVAQQRCRRGLRTRGRWAGNGDVSGMGREGARWDGRRRDVWRSRAQNTQTRHQTSTLSLCLAHVWTLLRRLIRITGCPRPRFPPWGSRRVQIQRWPRSQEFSSGGSRELANCMLSSHRLTTTLTATTNSPGGIFAGPKTLAPLRPRPLNLQPYA